MCWKKIYILCFVCSTDVKLLVGISSLSSLHCRVPLIVLVLSLHHVLDVSSLSSLSSLRPPQPPRLHVVVAPLQPCSRCHTPHCHIVAGALSSQSLLRPCPRCVVVVIMSSSSSHPRPRCPRLRCRLPVLSGHHPRVRIGRACG